MRRGTAAILVPAILATCMGSTNAAGLWPNSVLGTWRGSNNKAFIRLDISVQDTSTECNAISGTLTTALGAVDTIQGFYCPASGRISFVREFGSTGQTIRFYSGNISESSSRIHLAGRFAQTATVGNAPPGETALPGEYGFTLQK